MGEGKARSSMENRQGTVTQERGLLQRCLLVFLGVSSAVLIQLRRTPGVGPVITSMEDAVSPYVAPTGEHLEKLLAFADKQLLSISSLFISSFPALSPFLKCAYSVSDSALSVVSEAAATVESKGFVIAGVDFYNQYKPAAARKSEVAAQYLERCPVAAPVVPSMRYVGAIFAGVMDKAVETGRPKPDTEHYPSAAEETDAGITPEDLVVEEAEPAENVDASPEQGESATKDAAEVDEKKLVVDAAVNGSSPEDTNLAADKHEDVHVVESLFDDFWATGARSRRPSRVS